MPLRKFIAAVKVRDGYVTKNDRDTVIAEASRYLAYGDQSDVFGYHGAIENVVVTRTDDATEGQIVEITFQAMIPYGDVQDSKLVQQMEQLSRVEGFTELK